MPFLWNCFRVIVGRLRAALLFWEDHIKIISFDYDDTITADVDIFMHVMELFRDAGWRVIICTMRYPREETPLLEALHKEGFPIYYTGRKAKIKYLSDLRILPDVWVDDIPLYILKDAR